ncbi:hypothetical protein, partial [Pseudomonas sp. DP16D-R1]|uniref:hypothetical protein n=1 Tax=Pseudomonas sp. DP16D-R1 TaxID=2075551 RepID=UPI001C47C34B
DAVPLGASLHARLACFIFRFLRRPLSNPCYDVISNGENAMTDEALNALFGKADYWGLGSNGTKNQRKL